MPVCIYCLKDKTRAAFQPEHVFPRGLSGTGTNWTLREEVCIDCNGRFSRFEAHWFRQSIEAMARNFSGPISRNNKDRFDRAQPMEIDDLYIVNHGDPLVYEAGFAFPNQPHYRPQGIDAGNGVLWIAENEKDGAALMESVGKYIRPERVEITVPSWRSRHSDWLSAVLVFAPRQSTFRLSEWRRRATASGLWLRGYPHRNLLARDHLPETEMTSRVALDHRGRLYLRSANIETAVAFMTRLVQAPTHSRRPQPSNPRDQTVVFGISIDLTRVFLAVLKTGFNLFCFLFGADFARHPDFQPLRDILLDDEVGKERAARACRLDSAEWPDFPTRGSSDHHLMELDMTQEGILRFRLRLYGHIGYYAHLGVLPKEFRSQMRPRRIILDHAGTGLQEVPTW